LDKRVDSGITSNAEDAVAIPQALPGRLSFDGAQAAIEFADAGEMETAIGAPGVGPLGGVPFNIPAAIRRRV
jgi:hypothetical protein